MDIDDTKKRKIEGAEEPENMDVEVVLKTHLESTQNLLKLLAVVTQKVVGFEKVFNKDLFTSK